jgi:hypothetical protein
MQRLKMFDFFMVNQILQEVNITIVFKVFCYLGVTCYACCKQKHV